MLLSQAPQEAGAILLCNPAGPERLVVEEARLAGPLDCRVQGPDRLEFAPSFVASAVKLARDRRQSVILVHTHPFSNDPFFSPADDFGESRLMPSIYQRAPGGPHGALVLGSAGFRARLQTENGYEEIRRILEVGEQVRLYQESDDEEPMAEAYGAPEA